MSAGAYWRCPICLRRVPGKVVECYCGRIRQPGDGPDEEQRPKRFPLGPASLGALLVAAVGLAFWLTRSSPPPVAARGALPSPTIGVAEPEAVPARPGADASAPPTATTMPAPALAYDVATRHLRHRLRSLVARLDQFERICGPGSRHSSCDPLRDQIAQEARDIRATYDAAEEKARQAWLEGGLAMDIRQRNEVTEADVRAVLSRAAAAGAR
ncbi:MAG TPA: hypothetical protein VFM88_16525 [Vicinamibacteria bacterium]|nr:hypothetical protein [Vicinamibacteria bacterium]